MKATSLSEQISFLREIEKLKGVQRANRTLDGRFENSAEHSWHVALMALLLEEHASSALDMLKVTRLLLIHERFEGHSLFFVQNLPEALHELIILKGPATLEVAPVERIDHVTQALRRTIPHHREILFAHLPTLHRVTSQKQLHQRCGVRSQGFHRVP